MNCRCLSAATVRLGVQVATREEAVRAVAEILRDDPRVGLWEDFWKAIGPNQVVELGEGHGGAVCLVHARRSEIVDLALAAMRLASPVIGEKGELISLFFAFAIPTARAAEYLRAVGALARACGDAKRREDLMAAKSEEDFARLLARWIS